MYTEKLEDGYYVKTKDFIVNGPFDNEQDAQEYIDELAYNDCCNEKHIYDDDFGF
ncbi:MAG: hypothetical protein MN733_13310 [Nitrososphaera sp.]|nr:hypothetical protein [Nitrososphaera sp.]